MKNSTSMLQEYYVEAGFEKIRNLLNKSDENKIRTILHGVFSQGFNNDQSPIIVPDSIINRIINELEIPHQNEFLLAKLHKTVKEVYTYGAYTAQMMSNIEDLNAEIDRCIKEENGKIQKHYK